MAVIGHVVTRNEADRYLTPMLSWLEHVTGSAPIVYDDRSDDETCAVLEDSGAIFVQRPSHVPSFVEDESALRWAAWQFMEKVANPSGDDWVLCLDADELLVDSDQTVDVRARLEQVLQRAERTGLSSLTFAVHEVFDVIDGVPWVRVDGFWKSIQASRLVRWRPGARFSPRTEGGGSIPAGWNDRSSYLDDLGLLHLGYARAADRQTRRARYANGAGHNLQHIDSILRPPSLRPWTGTQLDVLGVSMQVPSSVAPAALGSALDGANADSPPPGGFPQFPRRET